MIRSRVSAENLTSDASAFRQGVTDIVGGIKRIDMAFYFAWGDTKARYRRSFFGPLWIVLGTAISVAGLGYVWSLLLGDDPSKLVPSLTIGLIVWMFLSGCILESSTLFSRNAHFIKNIPMPYSVFPAHLLMRQLINFGHNLLVVVAVFFVYPQGFGWMQLLFFPGLILVVAHLCWMILLLSVLGVRSRDTEQLIAALMPVMFFLSPVIYRASQLDGDQYLVWLNPFSYLISLIRDPIMGAAPPNFVYVCAVVSLVFGWAFTIYIFGRFRHKIAFFA